MMNDIYKMSELAEEYVYMIALNTKGRILGIFEIGHGSVNGCLVGIREVMLRALLCGAVNIILIHNHPSGDCEPSTEDFELFNRLSEAGKIIGIPLVDNIIIAGDSYKSFKEEGIIK